MIFEMNAMTCTNKSNQPVPILVKSAGSLSQPLTVNMTAYYIKSLKFLQTNAFDDFNLSWKGAGAKRTKHVGYNCTLKYHLGTLIITGISANYVRVHVVHFNYNILGLKYKSVR